LNPNGDNAHTWTLAGGEPTGWESINDWDDAPATRQNTSIYASTGVTEKTDFESPSFSGNCESIDVKIDARWFNGPTTIGVSLYDGASIIGSEQTQALTAAWAEYAWKFTTSKTAAELSDLRVWFRYVSPGGNFAFVAACQVDIKLPTSSSSSSCSSSSSSTST